MVKPSSYNLQLRSATDSDRTRMANWPSLSFRSDELSIVSAADVPLETQTIFYESNPERGQRTRQLVAQIKMLEGRRRDVLAQRSKRQFDLLCKRYTSFKSIRVWTGRYDIRHKLVRFWTPPLRDLRWYSKSEYLEWLIRQPTTTLSDAVRFTKTIGFLRDNPKLDTPHYRYGLIVGRRFVKNNLTDLTSVPRMATKVVARRNWKMIRRRWQSTYEKVNESVALIDRSLQPLRMELQRLTVLGKGRPWNKMFQVESSSPIQLPSALYPQLREGLLRWAGTESERYPRFRPSQGEFLADAWLFPANPMNAHESTADSTWSVGVIDPITTPMSGQQLLSFARSHARPCANTASLNLMQLLISTVAWSNVAYKAPSVPVTDWSYKSALLDETGLRQHVRAGVTEYGAIQSPIRPAVLDLDEVGLQPVRVEDTFDDRHTLSLNKLLALDLGERNSRDAVVFNLTRSLGELKDTPMTVGTLKDFSAFVRGSANGLQYLECTTSSGAKRFVVPSSQGADDLSAHLTRVWRQYGSRKKTNLGKLSRASSRGFKRIVLRRVTGVTTLAHLSSLYLAWKFGISQTLNDGRLITQNGWSWACQLRRGLNQLMMHLDPSKNYHVLRRMWSVMAGPLSSPSARRVGVYEEEIPRTLVASVDFDDTVDIEPLLTEWAKNPTDSLPVTHVYGSSGLVYRLPFLSYAELSADNSWTLWANAHNNQRLAEILSSGGVGPVIATRNQLRGCVFARFTWKSLLRAITPGLRNLGAHMKIFHTAWELAPLSFVVDWFMNTQTLVQNAQALVEQADLALSPVGRPWYVGSARLWAGYVPDVNFEVSVELREIEYKTIVAYARTEYPKDHREYESGGCATVASRFKLHLHVRAVTKTCKARIARTAIRRCVRAPEPPDAKYASIRPRVHLSINLGKLGSLLAMLLGKHK